MAMMPKLRLWFYKNLLRIGPRIPRWLGYMPAYFVGNIAYFLDERGRQTIRNNLSRVIPDAPPSSLARSMRRKYVSLCMSMVDIIRLHHLSKKDCIEPNIRWCDPYHVISHRQSPGIFVTVHTNFELMACAIVHATDIPELNTVSLSHNDEALDELLHDMRQQARVPDMVLEKAPLGTLRVLRKGGFLGLIGDRDYTTSGIAVSFFGHQCTMPVGPAALSLQSKAMIYPCAIYRDASMRYRGFFAKPICAQRGGDNHAEIRRVIESLTHTYERFIRAAPSQWVAFHPAFDNDTVET